MAIIVDELTPEEVYERFQNNSIRCNSFTIYGIEAIFEYFETVEIDTEYEFFNTITWDSLFCEKKSAIELLQLDANKCEKVFEEIENIFLTSNIPTVGKKFLVFQKLHPNFFSKDINKLWDAYEEVCCRIATMKTLNQNVPEDINKLKQDIVKKINRIVKLIIFLKEE